jgi:hypothetical protein
VLTATSWGAGRREAIPPTFHGTADHAIPATGNLLLAISAHVQRDLPFVLAASDSSSPTARAASRTTIASTSASAA